MYDQDFANRIDIVINKIGGISKASALIGVSYPTIGRWKDGSSDPKLSNMVAFAKAADVTLDWLVSGENSSQTSTQQSTTDTNINVNEGDEYAYIPAYDIEVSAGDGSVCLDAAHATKHLAFRKQWLTKKGLQAETLAALFTKGDSMTPTIPESAAVIIDQTRSKPLDGKVYVIRIDDRYYVKRVQWLIGGGLRLISDNKLYDPLDITKEDMAASNIQVCGQVIHASYDLPD